MLTELEAARVRAAEGRGELEQRIRDEDQARARETLEREVCMMFSSVSL